MIFFLILFLFDHVKKLQICCSYLIMFQSANTAAATAAKSLQSCPTLCDPIDGSPTGSPVPGILQARTLERVAISFSNAAASHSFVQLRSFLSACALPNFSIYHAIISASLISIEFLYSSLI